MSIETDLLNGLRQITSRTIDIDENLLAGAVDSLSWVHLINLIEKLAASKGKAIDLETLLSSREISPRDIVRLIEDGK